MKKITAIIFTLFSAVGLIGQTADIYSGCSPLTVQFTPPPGVTNAIWDFGDGSTSNLTSPGHTFDESGMFLVQISENGIVIGDTTITVYTPTEIMISADEQNGCAPFKVQFTDESFVDPGLSVSGYLWDFGDGTSSSSQNPFHIYTTEGTFTVTLRVDSDEEGCTVSQSFPNYITVSGMVDLDFELDQYVACETPGTFVITNKTVDGSGYIYAWDFGNGETSDEYNPGSVTYTTKGTYTIKLTVDNGEGCKVDLSRTIKVGKPDIDISVKDTFCINTPYTIINTSNANQFAWSFGSGANPQNSSLRNPTVIYNTPGSKIVTFSAIASSDCKSDTFFTIFVEDPSATFTIDPFVTCLEPATYTFTHPNPNYAEYEYYVRQLDDLFLGKESESYTYTPPPRDSFYINRSDTFSVILNVTTHAGCTAEDSTFFLHRAPQAHFIPNISRGCAPLTVNFTEDSRSNEPITNWTWIFGDGDVVNTTMSEDMTHTYTEPGEYYVKIAIENADGCQDTSAGIFIYVGEPLTAEYTVDETEICLYESINMSTDNLDPRIDAYHFNTDEGRISDCYTNTVASHEFIHSPGVYPVTLTLEYNGCYSEIDNGSTITVNGSKSRIKYMTNCIEPLTVMLQDSSVNASTSIWYMNGDTINMDTVTTNPFNYTFDSTGNYTVTLITDDGTACPPDTSNVELKIREIKADFDLPEFVCANATLDIGAGASIDVDESCSKGYMWFGVAIRPRTLDTAGVVAAFGPGEHMVRLITEDVNGCTDTLDKETTAIEIHADFEFDDEIVCFPTNIDFTDLSEGDTTIVEWNWDFGNSVDVIQNPTNVVYTDYQDGIPVKLIIKDELGCVDSLIKIIPTYEPTSDVMFDPSNTVCLGASIDFTATDFTEQGHFLTYQWLFGGETIEDQNPSFEINQPGINPLTLIITEDSTGCTKQYNFNLNGINLPIADITTDATEFCVSDGNVLFGNESYLDGAGTFFWDYGNGNIISQTAPSFGAYEDGINTYIGGTYDVTLTVASVHGCSDTDMVTITMIEPSGQLLIDDDDNKICINDAVTFTLSNTVDVASFEIDFGEGNVVENTSPATNTFGYYPPSGFYDVVLSLISETGCKTSVNIPVEAFRVAASIDFDSLLCIGKADFFNAADTFGLDLNYEWDFGNGETSTNPMESVIYQSNGDYLITLSVADSNSGCSDEDMVTITIDNTLDIPNLFTPNGDNHNDFFDLIVNEECREMVIPEMFKVYNRWGNLMYDNELPLEGWNGKLSNGDTAPAEIYTFVVKVDGVEKVFKGTVTLIE
jgi:gliding motility-associated-like protein